MNISFIGLGHMGHPMACHLLKAGFSVKVFDVVSEAMLSLKNEGAQLASNIVDAAKDADIVITMLQTGQQVKDVCVGEQGLFENAKKNCLFIDCSSIEITTTRELSDAAEKLGLNIIDAPVSGGVVGAQAASLTFMVGGDEKNFERAKPILEKMGKKIIHAGAHGHGQAAKICNNLILGISMIAVSEGFNLCEKLGLDPKKFFEISSNASGQCWAMTSYCPYPGIVEKVPSNNNYKPGFMSKMMLKDLRLAEHAAESVNASIPLGAHAAQMYEVFVNLGLGDLDFSGIIKMLEGDKGP